MEAAADPERAIEMEIAGTFSFPMELSVGATFLIAEGGEVAADITAAHAIILGSYTGKLRASRSIRVGPHARVEGLLEAPQLEIADGAVVNGLPAGLAADSPRFDAPAQGVDALTRIVALDPSPLPPHAEAPSEPRALPADEVMSKVTERMDDAVRAVPLPATGEPGVRASAQRALVGRAGGMKADPPSNEDEEIFVASPIYASGVSHG